MWRVLKRTGGASSAERCGYREKLTLLHIFFPFLRYVRMILILKCKHGGINKINAGASNISNVVAVVAFPK